MGGGTNTTTTSTGINNPDVNATISSLSKGLKSQYEANPNGFFFDQPMYAGQGATTQNALSSLLSGSENAGYSGGIQGGIDYAGSLAGGAGPSLTENTLMGTAMGQNFGMNDPGYATLRNNLINDVTTNNLSAFNSSGMFGSDSNQRALSEGLGNSLANLDYTNYQNDVTRQQQALAAIEGQRQQGVNNAFTAQQALPSLYSASLAPSQAALQVGQLQDANSQAQLQAEADLAQREFNAPTDYLAKLTSILSGNAASSGTTTTQTQPGASPLQMLLGGGLGLAGLFL